MSEKCFDDIAAAEKVAKYACTQTRDISNRRHNHKQRVKSGEVVNEER